METGCCGGGMVVFLGSLFASNIGSSNAAIQRGSRTTLLNDLPNFRFSERSNFRTDQIVLALASWHRVPYFRWGRDPSQMGIYTRSYGLGFSIPFFPTFPPPPSFPLPLSLTLPLLHTLEHLLLFVCESVSLLYASSTQFTMAAKIP